MRDTIQDTHGTPEAMEKRHMYEKPVLWPHIHHIAHHPAIIDYIIMTEHNPLWETRCAGGILDIERIMKIKGSLPLFELTILYAYPHLKQIIKTKHAGGLLPLSDIDKILQQWQTRVFGLSRQGILQPRDHLPDGLIKRDIPACIHEDKRGGIRL